MEPEKPREEEMEREKRLTKTMQCHKIVWRISQPESVIKVKVLFFIE